MRDSLLTIWKEELGLSLVHTAAFLIAFVIAAALALTVYTALQGGDGDEGARSDVIIGALALRGSVVATANSDLDSIQTVLFTVIKATHATEAIDFSKANTNFSYSDSNQDVDLPNSAWTAERLRGRDGEQLEPGDLVDISVDLGSLVDMPTVGREFKVRIEADGKVVLLVDAETPAELKRVMMLR